jgi:hypothetical protein
MPAPGNPQQARSAAPRRDGSRGASRHRRADGTVTRLPQAIWNRLLAVVRAVDPQRLPAIAVPGQRPSGGRAEP